MSPTHKRTNIQSFVYWSITPIHTNDGWQISCQWRSSFCSPFLLLFKLFAFLLLFKLFVEFLKNFKLEYFQSAVCWPQSIRGPWFRVPLTPRGTKFSVMYESFQRGVFNRSPINTPTSRVTFPLIVLHIEKSLRNLIKLTRNQIVYTILP